MLAGNRRGTTWADTIIDTVITNGSEDIRSIMGSFDPDERRGMTITRILMCLYLIPSPNGAVVGVQLADVAIGNASQEAFAAGVVPNPQTAGEFPQRGWLYRCRHAVVDDSTPGYPSPVIREDLHAQRKIDTGEPYLVITNNTAEGVAFSIRVIGTIRMLLKLP